MKNFQPTNVQHRQFAEDGFTFTRGLFSAEEINLLRGIAQADQALAQSAGIMADANGGATRLALRTHLKEDIYSAFVCSARMAGRIAQLLGGPVTLLHYKMMFKEARTGGAWEWHQDYGYWYNDGYLNPMLASCMIAVDPATRENGCLQVLRGSHLFGRMNHEKIGHQTGADPERVAAALERHECVYCNMAPGDALFFHCNTLHRSDANPSPHPRWAFIGSYNRVDNPPYKQNGHAPTQQLEPWPDEKILEMGKRSYTAQVSA